MAEKVNRKDGANNFVRSMLESAENQTPVKPQTRFDNVNPADLEVLMGNIKKGVIRKR